MPAVFDPPWLRCWGKREVFLMDLWGFRMCKTSGILCTRRSVRIYVKFCILSVPAIGTRCWKNPENSHSSSNNIDKLKYLGWLCVLICSSVFFFEDILFFVCSRGKMKTGKLMSWDDLFRSAVCRERSPILQMRLNISVLVSRTLFGAIFTFNWREI